MGILRNLMQLNEEQSKVKSFYVGEKPVFLDVTTVDGDLEDYDFVDRADKMLKDTLNKVKDKITSGGSDVSMSGFIKYVVKNLKGKKLPLEDEEEPNVVRWKYGPLNVGSLLSDYMEAEGYYWDDRRDRFVPGKNKM